MKDKRKKDRKKTDRKRDRKKKNPTIDRPDKQSLEKPGEPMWVVLMLDLACASAALSAPVNRLLDDLEATVNVRVKLNDFPEMVEHRKGTDCWIHSARVVLEAELRTQPTGKLPSRLKALMWGIEQYVTAASQEEYGRHRVSAQKPGSVSAFPNPSWKCNKLVTDAYATGADVGLAITDRQRRGIHAATDRSWIWPALANSVASKSQRLRNLGKAEDLDPARVANGEILAFPAEVGSGHVGLSLGSGLILSAKLTGLEVGTVEHERSVHDDKARSRAYTGKE